jgi:hypothetical protein
MESAARTSGGAPGQTDIARLFADFAKAARGTAIKNHTKGDQFGETLAASRAEVYDKAAHIRTPPLMNFDSAGVQYTTARAWQFCAWKIDPSLPEVAPRWD